MNGPARSALAAAAVLLSAAAVAVAAPRPITPGKARAAATAVNLRQRDVPGLTQLPPLTASQVARGHRGSAMLVACYGGVPYGRVLADVSSPGFQTVGAAYGETVSSDTEIFPSAALAASDLAAAVRPRGRACVLAAYRADLAGMLSASQRLSGAIAVLRVTLAGVRAVGVRMTFAVRPRVAPPSAAVPIVIDAIGFSYGQAQVALVVISNPGAPPPAQERALAATLLARARTTLG